MLKIKKEGIILEPTDLRFESSAVLNPAVIQKENTLYMFYRAVQGRNYSSIGYCKLDGPTKVIERAKKPILVPELDFEKTGIEDPRIVFFEGVYYMTYTAHDGKNAVVAYAVSYDLKKWEKKGTISPTFTYDEAEDIFRKSRLKLKEKYFFFESYYKDKMGPDVLLWEKDAFLIPKKIKGQYALIHRILPDIQVIYFDDFKQLTNDYWRQYLKRLGQYIVLELAYGYESRNIGGGAPLVKTDVGWLMIYHAVEDTNKGKIYHGAAALLDLDDPLKVIGHLKNPLFSPTEDYETKGVTRNVVFPTGTAIFDNRLYIYYGAADLVIAVVSVELDDLLNQLLKS